MTSRQAARRPAGARTVRRLVMAAALTAASLALLASPGLADEPSEAVAFCLECHSDPSLTLAFDDGTEMSLTVDPADLDASVHAGRNLVCTDCHGGYDSGDHPSGRTFANRRAYAQSSYEVCKGCHFDTYTRALEGVHFAQMSKGNPTGPGLRRLPRCAPHRGSARQGLGHRPRLRQLPSADGRGLQDQHPRQGPARSGEPGRAGLRRLPHRALDRRSGQRPLPPRLAGRSASVATVTRHAWRNTASRRTSRRRTSRTSTASPRRSPSIRPRSTSATWW